MGETLFKTETIKTIGHKQTRSDSWRWWVTMESGNVYSYFDGTDQKSETKMLQDVQEGDKVKIGYSERTVVKDGKSNLYYDLKFVGDIERQSDNVHQDTPKETSEYPASQPTGAFSSDLRIRSVHYAIQVMDKVFDNKDRTDEGELKLLIGLSKTFELYFRGADLNSKHAFKPEGEAEPACTPEEMDEKIPFDEDDEELANDPEKK